MGYNSKKYKLWQKFFTVEVDQTFLKVSAKNLVKVTRIGKIMDKKKPPTLSEFPSSSAIKIVFSKYVLLIVPIIIRRIIKWATLDRKGLARVQF